MQRRGGWGSNSPAGGRVQYVSSSASPAAGSAVASYVAPIDSCQYSAEDAQRLIPGLRIVKDFISKEEEEDLLKVFFINTDTRKKILLIKKSTDLFKFD